MRISLKKSIVVVLLMCSLLPAYIVGSAMIEKNAQREIELQRDSIENATQAISDRINQQIKFITNLSSWYASNRSITRTVDNIYFSTVVWDMMSKFNKLADGVSSIYLINDEWEPVYDSQGSIYHLEHSHLLTQIKRHKSAYQKGKTVHTTFFEPKLNKTGDNGIALVTPLLPYKLLDGSKYTPTGYVLVLVSFKSLKELVEPLLLDGEGVEFIYGAAPTHYSSEGIVKVVPIEDPLFNSQLTLWFKQKVSDTARMKQVEESKATLIKILLIVLVLTVGFVLWFNYIFALQIKRLEATVDAYMHDRLPKRTKNQLFTEFHLFSNLLTKMWASINKHVDELTIKNLELSEANQKVQSAKSELERFNATLESQVEEKTLSLSQALSREAEQRNQLLRVIDFVSTKYEGTYLEIADMVNAQLAELLPSFEARFYFNQGKVVANDELSVVLSDNSCAGTIRFEAGHKLNQDESLILSVYIKQLSSWLELQRNLRRDAQTQCLNRKAFEEDFNVLIKRIKQNQMKSASLHIIDLNGLKPVNDSLGHDAGDYLICESAVAISSVLSEGTDCYRIGGDEFALLSFHSSEKEAIALTHKLRMLCEQRETLTFASKHKIPFSFAVGYSSTENTDITELFSVADRNMYRQKEAHYKATGLSREGSSIK